MKRIYTVILALALSLSACGTKEGIEVRDAWARESTQGENSAVYFIIVNHNTEADELIEVASNVAQAVEIHESKMEGDVMMMAPVDSVQLEPSTNVEFAAGGLHIMLIGLSQDLRAGNEIEVILKFKNSPDLTVKATVKAANSMN